MNSLLHVCMITHKQKNASGPRSHAFAAQLAKRGHDVTVLVISEKKRIGTTEYVWDGVRTIETPDLLWGRLRSGWDIWNLYNRIEFLRRENRFYDLIHTFETRPATIYPALYMHKRNNIPIITDWNDWWGHHGLIDINRPWFYRYLFGWLETYYEEAFRANAAGLTVIAKALENRAIKLGVKPERICYIPGGASIQQFPRRTTIECRKEANLPLDVPILGFASADSHFDMEIVMASLRLVAIKYPTVKLLITGKVKKAIHRLVNRFSMEDHVIFSGYLPKESYSAFLGSADVLLLPMADRPYNYGRWPNKMSDYLSLARPTVSNPIGDIKTLFDTYHVGLLSEWDPQDFADKIISFLDDPELAIEYGQKARWVAENKYNWDTFGEELEHFYYKILSTERQSQ